MTEAVEGPPLDAELLAVDTIARFMFTDMNIFQFGQAIDAIDAVGDGLSSFARTVANLFNEPDTQTVALQEPPVLTHPMAQERFKYLQGALNFDDYLRSSQSQSQSGGSAAGPSQAQSSVTVSPPPPNQQQAQNRRNAVQQHRTRTSQSRGDVIPASRSTSPAVPPPTLPSTLPATHASNARPRQHLQIPARASSSRAQLQIPVRASRSPSPRRSALPRRMGDYVVEPSSDSPVAHSKRKASLSPGNASNTSGDEEGLRNPKLRKGLTLEISSSDSDDLPSQVHKRPRTAKAAASAGASATTTSKAKRANPEELRQIAAARKVPEDQRIGPQVSAVLAQRQAHQPQSPQTPEASSSLSPRRSPQRLAAPVFNNTEASSSTAAIFGKTAPHYIGDIPLSKPARMSILGALSQLSEGWEGFEWVRSYRSGKRNTVKEQWRCLACTGLYTCSRAGQNTNLKTHRTTCPLIKDQDGQIVPQAQGGAAARKPSALTSTASSTVIGYTG
ncbi:unnamed protein product [Tilletia caries]|nr:unnamed protein product [Tilletia caries]